uniref:Uncharacterized protein n=1 Tax=Macrostomum lignano TaxID=282301 RepID=A0A1I8G7S1_9PLAT
MSQSMHQLPDKLFLLRPILHCYNSDNDGHQVDWQFEEGWPADEFDEGDFDVSDLTAYIDRRAGSQGSGLNAAAVDVDTKSPESASQSAAVSPPAVDTDCSNSDLARTPLSVRNCSADAVGGIKGDPFDRCASSGDANRESCSYSAICCGAICCGAICCGAICCGAICCS